MKRTFFTILISFLIINIYAQREEKWKEDINQLTSLLEKYHPSPYAHIEKGKFYENKEKLILDLYNLTDSEIIVRMMKLVSSLRDGHTILLPIDPNGFNHWFPVSFYNFTDGIYIISGDPRYREFMGIPIKTIGSIPAEQIFEITADLMSSDNEFGRTWNTFFMSSGDALKGLGIIKNPNFLEISALTKQGRKIQTTIKAIELPFNLEYRFSGEMYPPGTGSNGDYIFALDNRLVTDYAKMSRDSLMKDYPLHLQSRRAYWYKYIPEHKTIYLHMTHVTSEGRASYKSFEQFYKDVFEFIDQNNVEKFILDIRYNSGGDGSVLIPFVHQFIRCDKINQPGRLFTITGRKTFSAGVMLLDLMLKHTNTLIVGEPAGAPMNSYGDPMTYFLDNSKLQLDISTVYWQLTSSADTSRFEMVDIPAVFSGDEYFSEEDPSVDFLLNLKAPYKSLPDLLVEKGGKICYTEYQARLKKFEKYLDFWRPFKEDLMRFASRELYAAGSKEDGIIGFQMLVEQYPDSWRAWRDFGNAYLNDNKKEEALDCFQKGFKINPGYEFFREQIEQLK